MKISTKKYIKNQTKWTSRVNQAKFKGQEKANKVFNKSLDQWKTGHNEWKQRMEDLTKGTITRREAWIVIVAFFMFMVAVIGLVLNYTK